MVTDRDPIRRLLVWNHVPAKSLAFQYVTTLLPFLFLSGIVASLSKRPGEEPGGKVAFEPSKQGESMAAVRWQPVLSFRYSWDSGLGVPKPSWTSKLRPTHRQQNGSDWERRRWPVAWESIAAIRESQSSALATGRIASHLIGCEHLETIGQFHERRDKLQACMPANQSVLERYEWIILDRQERFQQSKEQIEKVELEARRLGFQVEQDRYDVVFLRRRTR